VFVCLIAIICIQYDYITGGDEEEETKKKPNKVCGPDLLRANPTYLGRSYRAANRHVRDLIGSSHNLSVLIRFGKDTKIQG
jgi:hypothetical protein